MKIKLGLAFGVFTLGLAVAVYAAEYSFYEQAGAAAHRQPRAV